MMRSLVVLLVAFSGFAHAILRKQHEGTEDAPPAASMRELKARLEDRLASQERELGVGPRGESSSSGSSSTVDSKKGSKKISRNGSKKVHYDDIELSFMIQMDEIGDTTTGGIDQLGDKFVFSGQMAIDDDTEGWQGTEEILGLATGSCVVCLSAPQWCCDIFLTFNQNGEEFFDFATVALSGYIEEDEGHLWVLGTGGDFVMSHNGEADIQLDPYGNPLIYTKLTLRA